MARQHGTFFPCTSKTNRLPWTHLRIILKAFCLIRTDCASSTLEISRNDSARCECSLVVVIIIIIIIIIIMEHLLPGLYGVYATG